jgi:hypothetical protein
MAIENRADNWTKIMGFSLKRETMIYLKIKIKQM